MQRKSAPIAQRSLPRSLGSSHLLVSLAQGYSPAAPLPDIRNGVSAHRPRYVEWLDDPSTRAGGSLRAAG